MRLLKWPHKRGSTCNHECLKRIVCVSFYWFVWCVIFSSNTQPMTCPLQVLMKANPTKATSTATSIAVSKPAQWIPSPKIIPSVDQQSHTWDDSEIVIHRMFTHIVTYYINCSRIWDTMSFGNGRPTVVPCKKKQLIFEWTIHCFFVVNKTSSSYISYLNVHPTLQVSKYQCYLV